MQLFGVIHFFFLHLASFFKFLFICNALDNAKFRILKGLSTDIMDNII